MNKFNWKVWGQTLLAAVGGAVLNSFATSGSIYARGGSLTWKDVAAGAVAAAASTVIAFLRRSPLPSVVAFDPALINPADLNQKPFDPADLVQKLSVVELLAIIQQRNQDVTVEILPNGDAVIRSAQTGSSDAK